MELRVELRVPGHTEDRCYTKQKDLRGSSGKRNGCAICGSKEHWKNECTEKGDNKDKRLITKRGSNSIRGRGRHFGQCGDGFVFFDVGSNTLRSLACQCCKESSKLI